MTWWWWMACQVDPLLVVGLAPAAVPPVAALAVEAAAPEPAPTDPAAAPPEPAGYDPISVPQGPREEGGVRWKGVSGKFDPVSQEDRDMFLGEDP